MAINFTGGTSNQTELSDIQEELYAESYTIRDGIIDIQEGHKAGADVYESTVSVTAVASSTGAVTASGNISQNANKTAVTHQTFMYSDTMDDSALLGTRFERSMSAGAFENVSDEWDRKVLIQVAPAIGENIEDMIWDGATSAAQTAIAALTPGAPQGSISAGAQTLVAAMPTNLIDSIPSTILHNASQAKATPGAGLGDYKKVLSITAITSSNIAAQYALMYGTAPSKVLNHKTMKAEIFAPLGHKQMIKIANNSVGAAQQVNFLVEGSGDSETISYNGVKINFVPLVGFMILTIPVYLKLLMDLAADADTLKVGPMADGADTRFLKSKQAMRTWVTNQRYITLYGG